MTSDWLHVGAGTVVGTAEGVRSGRLRAVDVVLHTLDLIDGMNAEINAFVRVDRDIALSEAARIDEIVAAGDDPGPLAGVPFGVKDLEDAAGFTTSHGSLVYVDAPVAKTDSAHVRRLRDAGAIPLGKTAASEFGMDSVTSTLAWGTTRNPWDTTTTPGGSSGGSAAAVAAGLVPFCTASDGGGSTRSPAAFTGLVGMKATHGLIGRDAASEFSVSGALATTVRDTARLLDVMAYPSPTDRTSPFTHGRNTFEERLGCLPLHGLRVAWSRDLGYAPVDDEAVALASEAAHCLVETAGMSWVAADFRPPNPFSSWLRMMAYITVGELTLDGIWPGRAAELTDVVRYVCELGRDVSPVDFAAAMRDRRRLEDELAELFTQVDVLITPATACPAFRADGPIPSVIDGSDATESGPEAFGMFVNMTWVPAISVPAGLTRNGLPVGVQLVVPRGRDATLLEMAHLLERVRPWPRIAPPASSP